MIHIYQENAGRGEIYYEAYKAIIGDPWALKHVRTLQNDNEFQLYLDILRAEGIDFCLHTLEEYDEYHLAVSSV